MEEKKIHKRIHHYYKRNEIEKEYKFWDTQLVPKFREKSSIELGPIKKEFQSEDIKKEPYELHPDMAWVEIDIKKEKELDRIYEFLNINYYEIEEYKEMYNKEFLRWQFTPIKNNKYRNILLSIQQNNKIIGFFSGLPMKLSVYGEELMAYNISFLCIDKKYRNKNLATIMFKEMFRRTYVEKIYQNIFVSKRLIPKPFSESIYYYKILADMEKEDIKIDNKIKFRPMEKKDIKSVTKFISQKQKEFKIHSIFNEDEIEHWFIPIKNVIYSFVKEDDNKNITDFISFYKIDAIFDDEEENWCYIYFNFATTMTSLELLKHSIILAKENGMDAFICNNIMDYEDSCRKLNFHCNYEDSNSYGSLKYYFNNFICPETEGKDLSLILI